MNEEENVSEPEEIESIASEPADVSEQHRVAEPDVSEPEGDEAYIPEPGVAIESKPHEHKPKVLEPDKDKDNFSEVKKVKNNVSLSGSDTFGLFSTGLDSIATPGSYLSVSSPGEDKSNMSKPDEVKAGVSEHEEDKTYV